MFTNIEIGTASIQSLHGDSYQVGTKVASEALAQIEVYEPSVCFVFASDHLKPFTQTLAGIRDTIQERMHKRFGEDAPGVPMLGCSTGACVHGADIVLNGVTIAIWASPYVQVQCSVAENILSCSSTELTLREDAIDEAMEELGYTASDGAGSAQLTPEPRCMLVITPGYSLIKDKFISKDQEIIRYLRKKAVEGNFPIPLPMWGGAAGDIDGITDTISSVGYQFVDYTPYQSAAVFATIVTALKIGVGMGFGFERVDERHPIPRFGNFPDTNPIVEGGIDPSSAIVRYPSKSKATPVDESALYAGDGEESYAVAGIASTKRGIDRARAASIQVDMDCGVFPEGTRKALRHGMRFGRIIDPKKICAILSVSCQARYRCMKEHQKDKGGPGPQAELAVMQEVCPPHVVPIGWYGDGEVGITEEGLGTSANWSHVILVLSDEFDEASMNRLSSMAREQASEFVQSLSDELDRIGTSYGLLSVEERNHWGTSTGIINTLLEGNGCSLFFVDDMKHFHLGGSTEEVEMRKQIGDQEQWIKPKPWEVYYKPGDGLTGWVAKTGITLNLTQRSVPYLEKLYEIRLKDKICDEWAKQGWGTPPNKPPKWDNRFTENPDFAKKGEEQNAPFLATPVLVGSKIVGVLRVSGIADPNKRSFTQKDEYVIRACARVISLAHTTLERARQLRWTEIGFLNWARLHQLGGAVQRLDGQRYRLAELLEQFESEDIVESKGIDPILMDSLKELYTDFCSVSNLVSNTYRRFKEVTKVDKSAFRQLDLVQMVTKALREIRHTLALQIIENVTLRHTLEENISVQGSDVALPILLHELMLNAAKVQPEDEADRIIHISTMMDEGGDHLILTVRDTGPGIFNVLSAEKAKPARDHRRGAGLAICEYIAKQHGAAFYIESPLDRDRGTAIHIVFHNSQGERP